MILPTAAISVDALLSTAMLFGSFPNGGLGLPQNVHGGQSVNPYAAMAAATSAATGTPFALMGAQPGFRPSFAPLPSQAYLAAQQQQLHYQQLQFFNCQ